MLKDNKTKLTFYGIGSGGAFSHTKCIDDLLLSWPTPLV